MTAPLIPQVPVAPGSRLEELLAVYDDLKAQADEAGTRFESVKTAIKAELAAAVPNAPQVEVTHPALAQALRLSYSERWDLDTKRMKVEDPETYVRYARKSGRWELRGVKP